jgi:hypothetical protein
MIIGNLMTYGLRMRVNRAVLQSVLPLPLSMDDVTTLLAIPGSCVLFALGALLVEWLGLKMLLAQEKVRVGAGGRAASLHRPQASRQPGDEARFTGEVNPSFNPVPHT